MSKFADLKVEFNKAVRGETVADDSVFRFWLLKLLFEIHGDLDSLSYRLGDILRKREKVE